MFYLKKQVRILVSSANYLNHYRFDILHTLYNTFIDPYWQYSYIARATINTSSVDILFRMQKNGYSNNYWQYMEFTFWQFIKSCNNLKLADINLLQVDCFVYQVINGNMPDSFCKLFCYKLWYSYSFYEAYTWYSYSFYEAYTWYSYSFYEAYTLYLSIDKELM